MHALPPFETDPLSPGERNSRVQPTENISIFHSFLGDAKASPLYFKEIDT